MMDKKLLGTIVVGLVVLGFATKVSAQKTVNGNEGISDANVKVIGTLGDQDNTDPGTQLPDGDDKWINVTLPISTVFFAKTGNDKEEEFIYTPENIEQKIENHSARPVKVMLENYSLKESDNNKAITELNLRNADLGTEIKIAENGSAVDFTKTGLQEFSTLKEATKNGTGDKVNFDYTGLSNPTNLTKDSNGEVEGILSFKFISLPLINDETGE